MDETVTIQELNTLGDRIKERRDIIKTLKEEIVHHQLVLKEHETSFIAHMVGSGLEKYSIPGFGTAYVKTNFSYKVPKETIQREAFFDYLRSRGIFESMATVHSRTLNAWAKEEMSKAIESGATDFQIPGLDIPTSYDTLGVRK